MSGTRFETQAAHFRAIALTATIIVAHKTKSAVAGMLIGLIVVLLLSWVV
jgi:branched-subunit amino acid transport protein